MNDMPIVLPPEGEPDQITKIENLLTELKRWRPQLEAALSHGAHSHTFDDLVNMVLANRVFFYSFEKSFLVMEVVNYPQFKVFHCFLAGGKMSDVFESEQRMMPLAKELGCKYLSIAGRKGWMRLLKPKGWRFVCATMYQEVK